MEQEIELFPKDDGEECSARPGRRKSKSEKLQNPYIQDLETLDYDAIENKLHILEERNTSIKQWTSMKAQRWLLCIVIGILTGGVAVIIHICINQVSALKMRILEYSFQNCVASNCLWRPLLIWIVINCVLVTLASVLTIYIAPVAAGSGIPHIKCYLNGVKVPEVVRLKTLFTKVAGIIAAVSGGLAVGKEGPMVHSGAVLAAGISQGCSTTMKFWTPFFKHFRNDREKRDFVCAGAAAGVSSAFGAPVGGVLFSLEEASSFWNQALTWRIFLCSLLSSCTLSLLLSLYHGNPGDLASHITFGKFYGTYTPQDLLMFLLMGAFGGLSGAIFNSMNIRLMKYRIKYLKSKWLQVIEAANVASVSGIIAFCLIYMSTECKPLQQKSASELQLFCYEGEYNTMASLYFSTPEFSVKSLFHHPPDSYSAVTLLMFVLPYYFLACWTYGLKVPSGLFIPSLLIGAAWGRLAGVVLNILLPDTLWTKDIAKYSLMGAAAQLGGTVRMTLSLTVILIEATGNISYGFPLMAVLLISKFIGDMFNASIYDMHTELANVPVLDWDPPPLSSEKKVSEIMHKSPIIFGIHCRVKTIVSNLQKASSNHGGYPVEDKSGKFRGVILRSQLLILLKHKIFRERPLNSSHLQLSVFRDNYPNVLGVNFHNISPAEQQLLIDLDPYLNPAPYVVHKNSSFPRIYRLFRALGLRHLVVIDDDYKVSERITMVKFGELRMFSELEELIQSLERQWLLYSILQL